MSKLDLSNVSFTDLIELRGELDTSIEVRKKEEKQQLLQEIRQMILEKGFSVEEVFGNTDLIKKGHVAPKYRNPDNPDQKWSGRGRQPRWMTDLLEQGKTLEDLLIG
uniref:DNA-binding protein H-NS n=1 Tax=Candidatus Kentrum sp. LFY TaxID=2126342 RepID=A0A450WBX9_9GAMM|nr:MAG: DNA-binding protein H-NS [Candidatus Kentron sp. LFY]VFJ87699.1 MAG: DNA-binding protein H-NS [Candidatus Kentron sp. LFY]VFK14515.1 MAG: DNA-binding protein H-NS [Candidatus Kentron sp. LFY]